MTKCLSVLLLILACLGFYQSLAQSIVDGVVLEKTDNSPIPGANVIIKGTNQGTTTDMDGKYSLEMALMSNTLSFSSIG